MSTKNPIAAFRPQTLCLLVMGAALILCALLASAPVLAQNAGPDNRLVKVALGKEADFARLVFTFEKPLQNYVLRRDDVDLITVDFGAMPLPSPSPAIPTSELVSAITLKPDEDRLTAEIQLASKRYELRHFASRDHYSVVVDIKDLEDPASRLTDNHKPPKPLERPAQLFEVARMMSLMHHTQGHDSDAEKKFQSILKALVEGRNQEGLDQALAFKSQFPNDPLMGQVSYLLGDIYYNQAFNNQDYFKAIQTWQEALNLYPKSDQAPRASFMIAEAHEALGERNEAAAQYKLTATDYPQHPLAGVAIIRSADLHLAMGETELAKRILEPLVALGLDDRLGLEAYARMGMANFYTKLHSQASEILREVLDRDPVFYQHYPDILYGLGESYAYLKRPEMARAFLMHAINLMPNHPMVNVMMARVGDAYNQEGRQEEAVKMYTATGKRFPGSAGGVVSLIRLADLGRLSSFFNDQQVFEALERGTRQATVDMYQKIIEGGSSDPIIQVPYLKIGQALAEDGNNHEAAKWLRDLVNNYPNSSLAGPAKAALSRAMLNEAQLCYDLDDWDCVINLSEDNSSYLEGPDKTRFNRILAKSYENTGQLDKALATWKILEEETPEKRRQQLDALMSASLQLNQPSEALKYLLDYVKDNPKENVLFFKNMEMLDDKIMGDADAGRILAVTDLVNFAEAVNNVPMQKTALIKAAEIEEAGGRYKEAARLYDKFRQNYPHDDQTPGYLLKLADLDRKQNNYDETWKKLAQFRLDYPDDPRAPQTILDQVADAEKLDKPDDARRFLELYRALYPDSHDAADKTLELADILNKNGRYSEALGVLAEFRQTNPDSPKVVDTYFRQVRWAAAHNQLDDGLNASQEFDSRYPDDPRRADMLLDKADLYVRQGLNDKTFEAWNEFDAKYPGDPRQPDVLLRKAKDYFALGRNEEGLAAWSEFRDKYPSDPRTPDLLLIQARQEMKENQANAAAAHFQEYIDKYTDSPKRADTFLELATLLAEKQDYPGAFNTLEGFRRLYANHPGAAQAVLDQIAAAEKLGYIDQASELYSYFRRTFPKHPKAVASYQDQARMLAQNQRLPEAVAVMEEALVTLPETKADSPLYADLAETYLESGQVEKWAATSEQILAAEPNPQANLQQRFNQYVRLAQVYQELERPSDAERNFDAALANLPPGEAVESVYAIASAYKKLGNQTKYIQTLQKVVEIGGDSFLKKAAQEELSSLGVAPAAAPADQAAQQPPAGTNP